MREVGPAGLGGLARGGNTLEGSDPSFGEPQAQLGLGNEGELFSLQSGFAGGGTKGGRRASCAFQGFPPTRPCCAPFSPPPPQPRVAVLSWWCGPGAAVWGAEGWPRPALCCGCNVTLGCYRSGRVVPVRAGHWRPPGAQRPAFPSGAQAAPPPPLLLGSGGSQFVHAKKRTLDPLSGAPRAPALSQPESWHLSGGRGERDLHKGR